MVVPPRDILFEVRAGELYPYLNLERVILPLSSVLWKPRSSGIACVSRDSIYGFIECGQSPEFMTCILIRFHILCQVLSQSAKKPGEKKTHNFPVKFTHTAANSFCIQVLCSGFILPESSKPVDFNQVGADHKEPIS